MLEPWQAMAILRQIPFFSQLGDASLEALAARVFVAQYRKNQILFIEGEPARTLYFICSGRVKVYRTSPDGREQLLHLLGHCPAGNPAPGSQPPIRSSTSRRGRNRSPAESSGARKSDRSLSRNHHAPFAPVPAARHAKDRWFEDYDFKSRRPSNLGRSVASPPRCSRTSIRQ